VLERLSPEDARILALEAGSIVGHTCKVIVAESTGDTVERLRTQIEQRLALAPRLRSRLAEAPFGLGAPAWVDDPGFDVSRHVRAVDAAAAVDRPRLLDLVARLMSERLPRDRPLWAIDVVEPLVDGGVAAIWRIHHALADGGASLAIGSAVLWSESPHSPAPAPLPPAEPVPGPGALLAALAAEHVQKLAHGLVRVGGGLGSSERRRAVLHDLRRAPATMARELKPTRERSPLDLDVGRRRRVAFIDRDLQELHAAAHGAGDGVTINDVLLSIVAGGLRSWLLARRGGLAPVRVQVPVSLHRDGEAPGAVPNRDSFINVALPVQEEDGLARVRAVNEQTRLEKAEHDAEELYALFADVGYVSGSLFRLAHRIASNPHVFALSVSNVRGPSAPMYLAGGGRILELHSLAEIAPHHALRVSAASFAGRMSIGCCADAETVPDVELLAEGVSRSLDELLASVAA
jgi:diacylglycerol O-acyltransferase / wax synthase